MIFFQDYNIDVALITETWLVEQSNNTTAKIKSYGYDIIHDFRNDSRGGGTAVIFKAGLSVCAVNLNVDDITSFGFTTVNMRCCTDMKILFLCLYRTGPITKLFFDELNTLLAALSLKYDYVVIGGDFNIHVQNLGDKDTIDLKEAMKSYGFGQCVKNSTHCRGGTLDLLYDNSNLIDVQTVEIHDKYDLSDHYPIIACTKKFTTAAAKETKKIVYRDLRSIDRLAFAHDLSKVPELLKIDHNNLQNTVAGLFGAVTEVLDTHAPVMTKTISYVHTAQWFDSEYKEQRTLRRKAERRWLRTQLDSDKDFYKQINRETNAMAKLKKQKYYQQKINSKDGDARAIYDVVNKEMDRKQKAPLPECDDMSLLAKNFNNFFIEKIKKIRDNLSKNAHKFPLLNKPQTPPSVADADCLMDFEPCTIEELKEIIADSGINCSPSDFLPTELLKENIDIFLPSLCELVNLSLSTGSMDGLKVADIIPNIKGQKVDPNEMKNYRPISNLTFLGKMVERVVLRRLNLHMDKYGMHTAEQSAYKKFHSTETILIKVVNDLLVASDKNSATILMLLDLSAAFDTVDHRKLIKILENEINIKGVALKWFRSFLTGRCQRTRLGSNLSEDVELLFGVPQGSVLGPVLFNIYIRSLYTTVKQHGFAIQGYADDQQIYKSFSANQQAEILTWKIVCCFYVIQRWMSDFCLQLNPSKTQIIVVGPQRVLNSIKIHGVQLMDDLCVRFVTSTKSLGFLINENLSFHTQVMALKRDCFRLIRNICKMRFIFGKQQLKLIVNSLVICKLDYCNSLFYGINERYLKELQIIQNAAGKVVFGLYKHDHVGDTLKELHWLPVRERIQFKILLLVFKSLNGLGPTYLAEMLNYANYSHNIHLIEPAADTVMGDRAFQRCAPQLWNNIPASVKTSASLDSFKTKLKTYLFDKAYGLNGDTNNVT